MSNPRPQGRMIRKDISRSKGFAKLSPKAAALFCLVLPHLDSFGKSNGDPGYVKAEMVPLIPWLTIPTVKKALAEIDRHTNLRWFKGMDGTLYLHALNFPDHQDIRKDRLGPDRLPSHPSVKVLDQSGSSPGVVPPEVEVEVEVEGEVKDKREVEVEVQASPTGERIGLCSPSAPANDHSPGNGLSGIDAALIEQVPDDLRKSVKSMFLDVREGIIKKSSMREVLQGHIPDTLLDTLIDRSVPNMGRVAK